MIKWASWDMGAKTMFIAACVAVMSMLMNWVDVGFATRNGLSQGTFLFLLLWIYPIQGVLRSKHIIAWLGCIMGALSALLTLFYIDSKQLEVFDRTTNVAAMGAYVFLFASIALVVGCFMYHPIPKNQS